jgi:hexosaminidase
MKELYLRARARLAYAVLTRRFARMPVADGDIVFLGDSITAQGAWAEWFGGRPIVTRGIGGDRARGVLARVDQILGRPSKVFLMVGTNDVWRGAATEQLVDTVRDIVSTIQRQSPSTTVYVESVTPRTAALAPAIRAANAGLRAMAAELGATYVELFELMCDEAGGLRPGFSDDELHLRAPAYDIWREAIRPLVDA